MLNMPVPGSFPNIGHEIYLGQEELDYVKP